MGGILNPAVAALIGILLGGGLKALGTLLARRHDARTLLSSLVAEVEACVRLARHRQFYDEMLALKACAEDQVKAGRGNELIPWFVTSMNSDYFAIFHASLGKIGLLKTYQADRITRFYALAKAALENSSAISPYQKGVTAEAAGNVLENDLQLLLVAMIIGEEIAGFRKIKVPPAMKDIGAAVESTQFR